MEERVGCASLDFREVWARDTNLGFTSLGVFKATRLNEMTKGVSIEQEEERTKD